VTTWEYAHQRGRAIIAPALARARVRVGKVWTRVRPLTLPVSGAGFFVTAAFQHSLTAGLVAAGLGCFFVEWRAAK
jgi:hypothetical protein